ncbi:CHAP domain-containing protein [Allokutzneria albata]|uniref:CHAP domain-containing protein n=1 Tax=Allokutzneria albata TaxID=211114 RepID=A0A1G9VWG7_ALLAB|nr:CHAP domain-containing protein [Allokutzneria albata]SDM76672.1 CHAP domain-containing protein [Allokutzneria albata]
MENFVFRRLIRGVAVAGLSTAVAVSSVSAPAIAAPFDPGAVAPAVLEVLDEHGAPLAGEELRQFMAEEEERIRSTEDDAAVPMLDPASGSSDDTNADDANAMALKDKIVSIANAEKGNGEKPNGSNCTKYSKMCVAWCALFSTWVWRKAGVSIPQYAFTGDVYKWGKRHGKSYGKANLKKATKGDVLLFGTGPSSPSTSTHIGIVKSVSGSSVTMIEGNSQNKVRQVKRTLSSRTFYGGSHP